MQINLNQLFEAIPEMYKLHAPSSFTYKFLCELVNNEIKKIFANSTNDLKEFGPYGKIRLPLHSMGAI